VTAKYYEGQTLQIDLLGYVDITGAGTTQIKYRKPSGTAGAWNATVVNAEVCWLRYILAAASNDEDGDWTIWIYIVQADASVLIGSPLKIRMEVEGY
jgi:hypothetical protein